MVPRYVDGRLVDHENASGEQVQSAIARSLTMKIIHFPHQPAGAEELLQDGGVEVDPVGE
jgi:hypothetical protein